ncbi:putative F-box protein At5g55150 [Bidens hawaiensis]|uniref:putative F-box protein At5g55150 n=1 Tax=Bidens hawaiensis TaxID=980011 RepID=UPI00404A2A23
MTTWSDLLPEILNTISGKLEYYEDYINFLCVCTSWNQSTTKTKHNIQHLPSRFPMIMFAESNTNEDHDNRKFFLLSNGGTTRKTPLPEAHRQRCVSTHGWLVTIGEREFYTKLVNPLSHAQIDLPQLYMFDELYTDQDEWMYYGFCMRKALFTSSSSLFKNPSFRVVIIWGESIGYCRLGDVSRSRMDGWEGHLFDISYHSTRKQLYVVATIGTIYECDIENDVSDPLKLSRVATFPANDFWCMSVPWAYLLEWGHKSLLMVIRERYYFKKHDDEYGRYGSYRTSRFKCFVLDIDDGKWWETTSLENKAIFVGFNSSFAINVGFASDLAECVKRNCIYFTDDLYEPYRGLPDGGGGDVGIYDMFSGQIETLLKSQESVFRGSPPLWLQSSNKLSYE